MMLNRLSVVLCVCVLCLTAPLYANDYKLTNVIVLDGDTIRANIHLGFGVMLHNQTIRIANYDAWETSRRRRSVTITQEELQKGQKAKAYLQRLVAAGQPMLRSVKKSQDVYGRKLGNLYIKLSTDHMVDVQKRMILNKHVRK